MAKLRTFFEVHRTTLLLAGIVVAGAFLRLYNLGGKSFFDDETFYWERAVFLAQGGSYDVVIDWNIYMNVLRLIVPISQTEFALRLPSALAGILSIPVAFLLIRRLTDTTGGLVGASLFAFNPFLILVGQMVREHSLYLLFAMLFTWFFLRFLDKGRWADLAGLAVFSLAALFTHISAAWVMLSLGLVFGWALWKQPEPARKRLPGMLGYGLLIGLAGAFFWVSGFNTRAGWGLDGYTEWGYYWRGTLDSFVQVVFGNTWTLLEGLVSERGVLLLILALLLAVYVGWRMPEKRMMFLVALLPWLITIGTAMVRFYPYIGLHRNNIYLLTGIFILAAFGFSGMAKLSKPIFALGLTLLLLVLVRESWLKLHQPSSEEFRPVAERLCAELRADDQIFVADVATRAMAYYWPRCDSPFGPQGSQAVALQSFAFGDPQLQAELRPGNHNAWIVLTFLNSNERSRVLEMLETRLGRQPVLVQEEQGSWLYRLDPP